MGVAAVLVMRPGQFMQTFVPPSHEGSSRNLALIGQAVSEEIFENGGGRTPKHGYTISSPCEPDHSGELKI